MINFKQQPHHFSGQSNMYQSIHADLHKAPGTSTIATTWSSHASMTAIKSTVLFDTVGDVASSWATNAHCLHPSAHPWPLRHPHLFHF